MSERTVALGRSGLVVPRLGVGAMTWGDPATIPWWSPARRAYGLAGSLEDQREALESSVAAGASMIDTAAMYGSGASERRVGELIRGKSVTIATKFPSSPFASSRDLPRDLEASLKRLGLARVDLYQIHYPFPWWSVPRLAKSLAEAVEAGKGAVEVSNFSAAQVRKAHAALAERGVPLASNQIEYSLLPRLQPLVTPSHFASRVRV